MSIEWLLLALLILTVGGVACSFRGSSGNQISRAGAAVSLAGGLLAAGPAVTVLMTGQPIELRLSWQIPFGSFYVAVDPLSALFILIISVVCALAAIYGAGYLKAYAGRKNLGAAWCFFNLLFAGMLLITISKNGILFIMAWEAMSFSSFFLVMFEHEKPEVREAGWMYLTASHLGAACLLAMFAVMSGTGGNMDFDRLVTPSSPLTAGLLFGLAVLGFGAKAGVFPLHVWLPEAHPAAPSHVSAVMSGVMIKTGIYGLFRIIPMLGPVPMWWGWTFLIIGAVSGVFGVLYALCQHDLKRLLAYHSVENIGIICLGIGLWLLGIAGGRTELAALGVLGGLLHVCNHAIFKSLLFFGAGAIKQAVHTLEIEQLGGLQKRMPKTAVAFLIGAAAICGLPPLNGFVSEFLIFIGAFGAVAHPPLTGNMAAAGMTALLSLSVIGGLAAACFTKVYGIIFLGEPRSDHPVHAGEAPFSMRQPMLFLAGLCILLGFAAPLGVFLVVPAAGQLLGEPVSGIAGAAIRPLLVPISIGGGLILTVTVLLAGLRHFLLRGRTVSEGSTWDCGYSSPTSRMQYTASSFAWPIIDMFRSVLRPRMHIRMEEGDFPQQAQLATHTGDFSREYLFQPVFRFIENLSGWLHGLQQGRNQLYILYIAVTVLLLLLVKLR